MRRLRNHVKLFKTLDTRKQVQEAQRCVCIYICKSEKLVSYGATIKTQYNERCRYIL